MVVAVLFGSGHECNSCVGSGRDLDNAAFTCDVCDGEGYMEIYDIHAIVGFDPADPLAIPPVPRPPDGTAWYPADDPSSPF